MRFSAQSLGMVLIPLVSFQAHALVSSMVSDQSISPRAIGSISVDSSSFLYQTNGRSTSATSFEAHFGGGFETSTFQGHAEIEAYTFADSANQPGFESREFYLSTQPGVIGGHQITLGRRIYEWSKVDKEWSMMSLWSPRFVWDDINPETIGMTGLFYTFESRHFKFLAMGSPLSIPERGATVSQSGSNIASTDPFWRPLPNQFTIQGVPTTVQYSLLTPALQDILFRPNFAVHGRFDVGNGLWASANTGVLPVNMTQLAAEFYDNTQAFGNIQVNIRPQLPMRNINTAEIGYDDPNHLWSAFLSASYEQPFNFQNSPLWLNPIITPSTVLSFGTAYHFTPSLSVDGGLLLIHEQPVDPNPSLPPISVALPSRFPVKQGIKLGSNWQINDLNGVNLSWIRDAVQSSNFVSLDVQHKIPSLKMSIGGGADLFLTDTSNGWVGQYYGDDRLRGWLKYAF